MDRLVGGQVGRWLDRWVYGSIMDWDRWMYGKIYGWSIEWWMNGFQFFRFWMVDEWISVLPF